MQEAPVFEDKGPKKRSFERGLKYEERVLGQLKELYGEALVPKPWIAFKDFWGRGLAQPDAILLTPTQGLVVEVKLTYKTSAEHKMRRIYGKLAAHVWPGRTWRYVQITRNLVLGLSLPLTSIDALQQAEDDYLVTLWR
jgi:hypothetical protein